MDEYSAPSGAELVYDALLDAGIELLVGLPGTQTQPLDRVIAERSEIEYLMARHETSIPHIAWGYFESSAVVAATLTVPGPGETNAMHGLKNALEDSVPILHLSAEVDPGDRGKGPIHEIDPGTYDTVVKENFSIERPIELREKLAAGISVALTEPYGPVRLGIPKHILDSAVTAPAVSVSTERPRYENTAQYEAAATLLRAADWPIVYAGGGARRSTGGSQVVRELAETLDAPVLVSSKGKGTFPEDDPRFLGCTGSHLPAGARSLLDQADVVLALGTDFDGVNTDSWSLPMGGDLVHVTLQPETLGASYDTTVEIVDDVTQAGIQLIDELEATAPQTRWESTQGAAVRAEYFSHLDDLGLLEEGRPASTPAVLQAVRAAIPRHAVVTTDVGGNRLWAKQVFETYDPETFITAGSWAGMGVGVPAAIGAKLANPETPVVCLTGDGGLMMSIAELHTAVEAELDLVVVIVNNHDYGVISKNTTFDAQGGGRRFGWHSPAFEQIADGFGCEATTVKTVDGARTAVESALSTAGVSLVDVRVRSEEPTASAAADYETEVGKKRPYGVDSP